MQAEPSREFADAIPGFIDEQPDRSDGFGQRLQDEMWARARLRPRASGAIGVRHCTHIFNSPKEIDQALAVVRALARG